MRKVKVRQFHNNEFYALCAEIDTVKVIKTGRFRWLGHLFRMQELDPHRKLTVLKPEGIRRVGRPKLRWLQSAKEN